MRIAIAGMAGTFPVGGPFWDYMQYVLGFHQLGHEVLYVEDTGQWFYSPEAQSYSPDGSASASFLNEHIQRLEPSLSSRWFLRDASGQEFGMRAEAAAEFCRSADLFINISAACLMREEYCAAQRVAFIDSDPMYTQAPFPEFLAGNADENIRYRMGSIVNNHHVFFTFGENVGKPGCLIPPGLVDWVPTRQPIVWSALERHQTPLAQRRHVFTTIGSWEPAKKPGILVGDTMYFGKSVELRRYATVAAKSGVPMELAIGGEVPREEFERAGWVLRDPGEVSGDPWTYVNYLGNSFGEWSVAKNAYVAGRTGWFSCRTGCYLALGVPAVVQDTGFSENIPVGEGLHAFSNEEQSLAAMDRIASDPVRESRAAAEIAVEHFGSKRILTDFLDRAFAT